ncbi:MAG: hybrid sensor histidine kinase/response regulator [Bacteroidales bacterium]|nr:hybrid sensor histidine kinase/response regulator [Bacteroidales bacterium]
MEEILSTQRQDIQPTVLIVDDINENLQVLGAILDEQDIEFSYATNGKEALEAVSFNKPDLILLDVNMSGMTGFEVCEILKKDPDKKDIPVIFLTAKAEPDDIITGLTVGGIDYITKPFNSKELITRVKSHLELSISKQIISTQNEQLKKLNFELREAIAAKDKFFSIIAHDLKDPFHTLIGFSNLLLSTFDDRKPEDIKRLLKYINQSSLHGFDLLNNLLEWSRTQTGSIKYNPVRVNLSFMVDELLLLLSPSAEKKEIHLTSGIPVDCTAIADEKMIQTVIRNLVSNALKYTEPGGDVRIESRDMGDEIEISVSDTGLGIPKENLGKLFSISKNYSTPGTSNERGTGLGLLLCKEFVEKNRGRIRIKSEPGEGSTFSFTIPQKTV